MISCLLWALLGFGAAVFLARPEPIILNFDSKSLLLERGFAYTATYTVPPSHFYLIESDGNSRWRSSQAKVFQHGVEIGPGHSLHDDIRDLGSGRFSHWRGNLFLSSRIPGQAPDDLSVQLPFAVRAWIVVVFCGALLSQSMLLLAIYWGRLRGHFSRLIAVASWDRLFSILNLGLAGLVGYLFYNALLSAPVGIDAGLILSVAERINDGWLPYRDIQPLYTPLAIMILAGVRHVFGNWFELYSVYLAVVLAAELLTGVATYWVGSFFLTSRSLRWLVALLSVLSIQLYEGNIIILEPFVTFFYLLALGFFFRGGCKDLFFTGLLASAAFLSKQYGGLGFVPFLIIIPFLPISAKDRGWRFLAFGIGALSPALLALPILLLMQFNPLSLLGKFWQSGYLLQISDLSGYREFLLTRAVFVLAIPLLLLDGRVRRSIPFWSLVLAYVCFSAALLIRPFDHYYILFLPLLYLIGGYMLQYLLSSQLKLARPLACGVLVSLCLIFSSKLERRLVQPDPISRTEQFRRAAMLNDVWGEHPSVVVLAYPWYSFCANLLPARELKPEYGFVTRYAADELTRIIAHNDKVFVDLLDERFINEAKPTIEANFGNLRQYLSQAGYCLVEERENRFQFWDRRCDAAVQLGGGKITGLLHRSGPSIFRSQASNHFGSSVVRLISNNVNRQVRRSFICQGKQNPTQQP